MDANTLAQTKRRVSNVLLDEPGVSGVGLRGNNIVIYLATDDDGVRARVESRARALAPKAGFEFDVAGQFRKQ